MPDAISCVYTNMLLIEHTTAGMLSNIQNMKMKKKNEDEENAKMKKNYT